MSESPPVYPNHTSSRSFPVFPNHEFWTQDRVEKFCRLATPIDFRSESFILSPEDPPSSVFLIEYGRASLYHYSSDGSTIIHARYGPGDLLGVKGAFFKPLRLFHTIADLDTRVWELPHKLFHDLLQEDFDFVVWFLTLVLNRLDILERKMLDSALLSTHHRLALTLLDLSAQSPHQTENSVLLSLTQQDLSNMLSVTRQTTGACLKDLQDKGILKTKRGQIEICDLAALKMETL